METFKCLIMITIYMLTQYFSSFLHSKELSLIYLSWHVIYSDIILNICLHLSAITPLHTRYIPEMFPVSPFSFYELTTLYPPLYVPFLLSRDVYIFTDSAHVIPFMKASILLSASKCQMKNY